MHINGVLGPIDTKDLGVTLMHEHVAAVDRNMCFAFNDWLDEKAVAQRFCEEMERVRPYGVKTFVDATPITLGRDVHLLAAAAKNAEVNILACTGFYWPEELWYHTVEPHILAEYFRRDLVEGMQGTDVKAAFVKCATDTLHGASETNRRFVRAAGIAAKQTGAPVYCHGSSADRHGLYQQETLLKEGVEPHRILIGHAFDSGDLDYIERVIRNGSYVGCDRLGFPGLCPVETLANLIAALFEKGYGDHVVVSHDKVAVTDFVFAMTPLRRAQEGNVMTAGGYTALFTGLLPLLRERGFTQREMDVLLVENPRRFFEGSPLPSCA